jgi:hypothetical protein
VALPKPEEKSQTPSPKSGCCPTQAHPRINTLCTECGWSRCCSMRRHRFRTTCVIGALIRVVELRSVSFSGTSQSCFAQPNLPCVFTFSSTNIPPLHLPLLLWPPPLTLTLLPCTLTAITKSVSKMGERRGRPLHCVVVTRDTTNSLSALIIYQGPAYTGVCGDE